MRPTRVMVLMHEALVPPEDISGMGDVDTAPWKTEYDVCAGLHNAGHDVRPLGVSDDLGVLREAILNWKPRVTFNLLEEFHGIAVYDHYVVSYLELMRAPYTGCNPRGLMLAHDKPLSKKILSYHRIRVPAFMVVPLGSKLRRPKKLGFPLLVKSAIEEASLGISQASIVTNDAKLKDRVDFVHEQLGTDALVEQYVDGRELYVGVLGNRRLQVLPVWEMLFKKMPDNVARIATAKVKWDSAYQKRMGIETGAARELPSGADKQIDRTARRVYQTLGLTGYARMDFRLDAAGNLYLLEANPNPNLAYGEDLAESAHTAGIEYETLLNRILNLGLRNAADWKQPAE